MTWAKVKTTLWGILAAIIGSTAAIIVILVCRILWRVMSLMGG